MPDRILPGAFPDIDGIPVTLNFDHDRPPVGVAHIHPDGTATIKIVDEKVIRAMTDETIVNRLDSLSIGFTFHVAPGVDDPIAEIQARLF